MLIKNIVWIFRGMDEDEGLIQDNKLADGLEERKNLECSKIYENSENSTKLVVLSTKDWWVLFLKDISYVLTNSLIFSNSIFMFLAFSEPYIPLYLLPMIFQITLSNMHQYRNIYWSILLVRLGLARLRWVRLRSAVARTAFGRARAFAQVIKDNWKNCRD